METAQTFISAPENRQIISSRLFNHSRELVFSAWTDPERLKNWWGPKDFTNTFDEFDFREGGYWRFVMHGPDGTDYPNESLFVKIVSPELIVFDHICAPEFRIVATFEEKAPQQTLLTFRMIFDTPQACERVKIYAVDKNEENFDRLERELQRDDFLYT